MKTLTKKIRSYKTNQKPFFRPRLEPLEIRVLLAGDDYFSQAQNGDPVTGDLEWVNGILNDTHTTFFEGMSTLQRLYIENITGSNHILELEHNAVSQGVHAYDFLTSWDQALAATGSIAPGAYPSPISDALACKPGSSAPSTFEDNCLAARGGIHIEDVSIMGSMGTLLGDDIDARIAAYEGFFGDRTVRIYGDAPITNAEMTFVAYNPQNEAQYTLEWTSDSSFVVIEFGAHIAQGQDFLLTGVGYGPDRGAGSISGGNYHVQLISFDDASTGSQDNQLQAGAVAAPPDFTIDKTGDDLSKVGDDVTYSFTITHTGEQGSADLELVSISDDKLGTLAAGPGQDDEVPAECDVLSPGESCTFDIPFTIPDDATDPFVNEVTAVYAISGLTTISFTRTDTHSTNLFQPDYEVIKTGPDLSKAGDEVTYTYTINNKSSDDSPNLELVSIVDDKVGNLATAASAAGCSSLAWNASCTFDVDFTIPADTTEDPYVNKVSVVMSPVGFPNQLPRMATHSVNLFQPGFRVDKTGDPLSKYDPNAPDPVNYTITVTNTSSADSPDLVNPSIIDDVLGDLLDPTNPFVTSSNADGVLSVGEVWTINATRNTQATDSDPHINTVTASLGVDGFPNVLAPDADSDLTHSVDLFRPGLAVEKTIFAGPIEPVVGDTLTFEIKFINLTDGDLTTPEIDGVAPDLKLASVLDEVKTVPDGIVIADLSAEVLAAMQANALDELSLGESGSIFVDYTLTTFGDQENVVDVLYHPCKTIGQPDSCDELFPNEVPGRGSVPFIVAQPVEEGRMTGGGSIFLPADAVPDDEGLPVRHGFQLHCGTGGGPIEDVNNRIELNWGKPNSHFHLYHLTSVRCLDTGIVQAPPEAPIDTMEGTGVGRFSGRLNGGDRLNNVAATLEFLLTDGGPDKGEPGLHDTAKFVITADTDGNGTPDTVVLDTNGPQLLQSNGHSNGNHQSHNEIPPLQEPDAESMLQEINRTLDRLDSTNLSESKIESLTTTLLEQFDQLEAILNGSTLTAEMAGGRHAEPLTSGELQAVLQEAIAHWRAEGVNTELFDQLDVRVSNLPGNLLGLASERTIWMDQDAAGHGWSVDVATPGSMDLHAAVTHELGHVLGFEHSDSGTMAPTLQAEVGVHPITDTSTAVGQSGSVSLDAGRSLFPSGETPSPQIVRADDHARFDHGWHSVAIRHTNTTNHLGSSFHVIPQSGFQSPYLLRPETETSHASVLDHLFANDEQAAVVRGGVAWNADVSNRVAAAMSGSVEVIDRTHREILKQPIQRIDRTFSIAEESTDVELPSGVEKAINAIAAVACTAYFLGVDRQEESMRDNERKRFRVSHT